MKLGRIYRISARFISLAQVISSHRFFRRILISIYYLYRSSIFALLSEFSPSKVSLYVCQLTNWPLIQRVLWIYHRQCITLIRWLFGHVWKGPLLSIEIGTRTEFFRAKYLKLDEREGGSSRGRRSWWLRSPRDEGWNLGESTGLFIGEEGNGQRVIRKRNEIRGK